MKIILSLVSLLSLIDTWIVWMWLVHHLFDESHHLCEYYWFLNEIKSFQHLLKCIYFYKYYIIKCFKYLMIISILSKNDMQQIIEQWTHGLGSGKLRVCESESVRRKCEKKWVCLD